MAALILGSFVSAPASAAADIALNASPQNSAATTDDAAEYDITIINTGDEDLTVTLSASQDSDCNGFTSNLEQTVFAVGQGESETTTLTVSVNDQASGDCVTTVNANGVASNPTENAQADVEVTTTAEGGGQYSVKLDYINPNNGAINYDGEDDEVEWTVDVENTGENDATVQLAMSSKSDCDSDGLDATVDPQQMSLSSGDKETATVTVTLPDGSSTESGDHCFVLDATVSNDPNPADQANDSINLNLKIPEVKTCDSSLQSTSHNLDPGESATNSLTLTNTGNTAWTVSAFATSEGTDVSDWVDFETPTSRLLSEPGGSQDTTSFDFEITPDDSVEPGTVDVYIQGRAGSSIGCESLLRVNLGQVHDATLSLSNPTLNNVDPGATASTSMMVTNTGNGQDNFALGVKDLTPGWQVELSETYVTIDGRHCSSSTNCDRKSVQVQITVPANAKSGIDFEITMYVNSQGVTLDEVTATVTVAEVHGGIPGPALRLPDGAVRAMGLVPHRAHQHGKHAGQLRPVLLRPQHPRYLRGHEVGLQVQGRAWQRHLPGDDPVGGDRPGLPRGPGLRQHQQQLGVVRREDRDRRNKHTDGGDSDGDRVQLQLQHVSGLPGTRGGPHPDAIRATSRRVPHPCPS